MEEKKLCKVYSNNSKKRRLKRSKKYARVWDEKLQKYVKIKKIKAKLRMSDKEMKEYFGPIVPPVARVTKEEIEEKLQVKVKKLPKKRNRVVPDDTIKETLTGKTLVWNPEIKRYREVV